MKEPNIYISGDEARALMALLLKTPTLQLYQKLNNINAVQPPQKPKDE